jgi:hypothetical protein
MSNFSFSSTAANGSYNPVVNSNVSPVPFPGVDKAEIYNFQGDGTATGIVVVCNQVRNVEGVIWSGNPLTAASWVSDGNIPPTVTATLAAAMTSGKNGTLIIFGK